MIATTDKSTASPATITDYTGQQIKKKSFVSVTNMLLIYFFASMKLEKEHKKLLGSSFKIMLPLWYITKRVEILYGTVD